MSLKEALDAAHGHEHAEDGSELTEEDDAPAEEDSRAGHDHGETSGSSTLSIPLMVYAGVMTLISLITLQMLMKRRQQESEAGNAQ